MRKASSMVSLNRHIGRYSIEKTAHCVLIKHAIHGSDKKALPF